MPLEIHESSTQTRPAATQCRAPEVARSLIPPSSWQPILVVVIDTEEEFDWSAPFNRESVQVSNIAEQHFAQDIFDSYGVVPTYAVDYPVAANKAAVAILAGFRADARCEIGAHLHPWVTPPHSGEIDTYHSYGGNLAVALENEKLGSIIEAIRRNFGLQPGVFRAGRYGIGRQTPTMLRQFDIDIDVSVVPTFDFSNDGGPDFSHASRHPYLTPEGLCEIPDSAEFFGPLASRGADIFRRISGGYPKALRFGGILARTGLLERLRLSPEGHTLAEMIRHVRLSHARGCRLFMMSYHSSSLLPGGNPYVRSEEDRRAFLRKIDDFLRFFLHEFGGRTDTLSGLATMLKTREAGPDADELAATRRSGSDIPYPAMQHPLSGTEGKASCDQR